MSVSALGSATAFAYSPRSASPASAAGTAERGAVAGRGAAGAGAGLSEADLKIVSELKARDRVVRTHEMAHMAAGAGIVTRGASYSYQTGPDGQRYAVGGEVGISTSPGRTPEETLAKADQIRAAALAPADPSAQDLRVAAKAAQMAAEARLEISTREPGGNGANDETPADSATGGPAASYAVIANASTASGSRVDIYA